MTPDSRVEIPVGSDDYGIRFISDPSHLGTRPTPEGSGRSPLTYGWNHGIGETRDALIQSGLRIDRVEEHDEWE